MNSPSAPLLPQTIWQELGLKIVSPRLRSSDIATATHNPRLYLVARRMGIVPRFSESDALNRGTWLHEAFRL